MEYQYDTRSVTDPSAMSESEIKTQDEQIATTRVEEDQIPTDDAKAAAALGAAGGLITGVVAGAVMGPLGSVAGGAIGAVVGGVASGVAVQAVDAVDHDGSPNEDHTIAAVEFEERSNDPPIDSKVNYRDPYAAVDTSDPLETVENKVAGDTVDDITDYRKAL